MVISYVLGLSIILQFVASALALRLIWITGRQLAWLLISSAILLMALRRSISFYILASQGFQSVGELSSELVALLTSLFMVVGIGLISGIFRDNKAREQTSRATDKIFRQFVETANEGVWSIDAQFKTTFINNRMADMLGYSPEEMLGMPLAFFLLEEDLPDFQDRMRKRAQGAKEIYERRLRQKDGTEIWTHVSAAPLFDGAEKFQGSFAMITDVTKLKQILENLSESEEKFSKVFRYAPIVMTLTTVEDGICLDVNDKFCELSGFTREEVIGRSSVELGWFSREDREQFIEKLRMHGRVSGMEIKQLSKDKGQFIFIYYGQLINVSGCSVLLSIAHDVTELRKARGELQRNEEKYRDLFKKAPLIYVITRNERGVPFISDCNELFLHSLGYTREEVQDKPLAYFYSPESQEKLLAGGGYSRALAGEYIMGERELVGRDGSLIQTLLYTKPEVDHSGNVIGTRAMFVDITDRKISGEFIRIRLNLLEYSASHSLHELLRKTLDEVGSLTNSPIGFYDLISEDEKIIYQKAWSTRTVKEFCQVVEEELHYPVDQAGVWADAVRERRPVIHNDYSTLSHRKGMPEGHAAVIRELVVPIIRSDRIVAILGIGNKPTDYTAKDVEVVSYLADVAWEITERKRAEEALMESDKRYLTLFEESIDGVYFS